MRIIKPLSDAKIRKAEPGEKPYRLYDGDGVYILIMPNGGKLWRFKYRFAGKEKLISLGTYPDVSLTYMRQLREEARQKVKAGVDPSEDRKEQKALFLAKAVIDKQPDVRLTFTGNYEIWKGSRCLLLTEKEARFVKDLLCKLFA